MDKIDSKKSYRSKNHDGLMQLYDMCSGWCIIDCRLDDWVLWFTFLGQCNIYVEFRIYILQGKVGWVGGMVYLEWCVQSGGGGGG